MSANEYTDLVGSRICHDLVNPLGAIGNGLELLAMSVGRSEEMALVEDALKGATAKLELFRLAFGAAQPGQMVGAAEINTLMQQISAAGRHRISWECSGELPRTDVRAALLTALCAETALVLGGEITIGADWRIIGTGRRINLAPELWEPLGQGLAPREIPGGAQVQFGLLPEALRDCGRGLKIEEGETRLVLDLAS